MNVVDDTEQPRYTIHQRQHTVSTTLIRNLPEQIVSRMLGQLSSRSTRRYAEMLEEQVRTPMVDK